MKNMLKNSITSFSYGLSGYEVLHHLIDNAGIGAVLQAAEEISPENFGCLRYDGQGHWFLIPETLLPEWEMYVNQEIPDMWIHTRKEYDDALIWIGKKFEQYRLKSGYQSLRIPMLEK